MSAILKRKAIILRKRGLTYSEILREVPVAKSTLSLWLRSVGLTKRQKQRITDKKLEAAHRGGQFRKRQRLFLTKRIKEAAKSEVKNITDKDLWLIGTTLYWAEGTKCKEHNPSQSVIFSNSDPQMIKLFLQWLTQSLDIPEKEISFEIYTHETHKHMTEDTKRFWKQVTNFPISKFDKIYYKRTRKNTSRKNKGENYHGLLRIRVRRSTNLNRKISGWIEGICSQCGVV